MPTSRTPRRISASAPSAVTATKPRWNPASSQRCEFTLNRTRVASAGRVSRATAAASICPRGSSIATTSVGPTSVARGTASIPAAFGMKWTGASTWVPEWTPNESWLTLQMAPSAIDSVRSSETDGSPSNVTIPGVIGTLMSNHSMRCSRPDYATTGRSARQAEPETCPTRHGLRTDATAGRFDELLDDREPDPGAASASVARFLHPVEALEDVWQVVGGNGLAGVRHRHDDVVATTLGRDGDRASGLRVADGVLEQVRQDLGETVRVGAGGDRSRDLGTKLEACRRSARSGEIDGRPDRVREIDLTLGRLGRARIARGELVERSRQPDETVRLLPQRFEGRPVRRDHAVAEGLEIALQVGQGRPELVRCVGDELASHPLLLFETGRHLVEGLDEAHDLDRADRLHPRRVIAVRDPGRGSARFAKRAREPSSEPDRQERRHSDRDEDGDREDGADRLLEHRLRRGRVATVPAHEVGERPAADDCDADREDRDRGEADGQRGEGDPQPDPVVDRLRQPLHEASPTGSGAAR